MLKNVLLILVLGGYDITELDRCTCFIAIIIPHMFRVLLLPSGHVHLLDP